MTWNEILDVTLLRRAVDIEVQIVNPRRCSAGGCAAFYLKSQVFQLP